MAQRNEELSSKNTSSIHLIMLTKLYRRKEAGGTTCNRSNNFRAGHTFLTRSRDGNQSVPTNRRVSLSSIIIVAKCHSVSHHTTVNVIR